MTIKELEETAEKCRSISYGLRDARSSGKSYNRGYFIGYAHGIEAGIIEIKKRLTSPNKRKAGH